MVRVGLVPLGLVDFDWVGWRVGLELRAGLARVEGWVEGWTGWTDCWMNCEDSYLLLEYEGLRTSGERWS